MFGFWDAPEHSELCTKQMPRIALSYRDQNDNSLGGEDFNEILCDKEEQGGPSRRFVCMAAFQEMEDIADEILAAETRFSQLLDNIEIFRKQISRAFWLKWGDHKTKIFHSKASQRKQRNKITGLIDKNGVCYNEEPVLEKIVTDYFQSLFSSDRVPDEDVETVLVIVQQSISKDMNRTL
ncbi:hypothetical protein PanWU01x14_061920 [Parasponia andersonii]|uniref:Uncharacterized protein n=1 Tax=Parasponia andersonii TaxID=3476 RepID=A0A2P5DIC1_PARAD|nr:hypothetical protein PanWU01x14_061920 [Parasponia andersonii]